MEKLSDLIRIFKKMCLFGDFVIQLEQCHGALFSFHSRRKRWRKEGLDLT